MKLSIICGAGIVSGKEIMALGLGEGLRAKGYSVIYVTSMWGNQDFNSRLRIKGYAFHKMRLGFISATFRLEIMQMTAEQMCYWPKLLYDYHRFLRRERPRHVIHTNWHHLLLLSNFLKPERDLFWVHEHIPSNPRYVRFFMKLSRRIGVFVAVSDAVADSLRQIGIPGSKVVVIHNGMIDISEGRSGKIKSTREIDIGIVGQIGAWKGHEDLLTAFASIADRHPDVRLHLFGTGPEQFMDLLARRVAALSIREKVVWHGYVGERKDIYSALDICAVPSRFEEPFGLVAIEAAFFGIPVVATKKGGLPEIVKDGVTGYLCEPENPQSLAARLEELVVDPEVRRSMGAAARERARACFSERRFIEDFDSLLTR
jgi:glycosyltransferase involved in cell wall biosynthesis